MATIRSSADRRKNNRFLTTMPIQIRFSNDGTPIEASCVEIGPNGMRVLVPMPLVEATYVHISFQHASNNTNCEGRVVWTKRGDDGVQFESGLDIQRWGGSFPGEEVVEKIPSLKPKNDRRKR